MASTLLLVDGFNLIRRIFEARKAGNDPEAVIEACQRSLVRAVRDHEPSHACVAWDSHDTTWRHLLYVDYKANRKPTPALLLDNLDAFDAAFRDVAGVASIKLASYEADDIIATMARRLAESGGQAIILSMDKLFLQLLGDGIRVYNHFDHTETNDSDVMARYGIRVAQLADFWALAGDSSNNIKGVPGIGPKRAAELLSRYEDLEAILAGEAALEEHADTARRCRQLVTLKTDVELGINLRDFRLAERLG